MKAARRERDREIIGGGGGGGSGSGRGGEGCPGDGITASWKQQQQQQQQSQGLEEPVGSSGRQQQASTRKSRKSHLRGQSGRGCRFAISAGSVVGPCQRPSRASESPLEPSGALSGRWMWGGPGL